MGGARLGQGGAALGPRQQMRPVGERKPQSRPVLTVLTARIFTWASSPLPRNQDSPSGRAGVTNAPPVHRAAPHACHMW